MFLELGCGDQIVELATSDDSGDKFIQLAWPVAAKPKLASQDRYALAAPKRVFQSGFIHPEWHIYFSNYLAAKVDRSVRVRAACRLRYASLNDVRVARPVQQYIAGQEDGWLKDQVTIQ